MAASAPDADVAYVRAVSQDVSVRELHDHTAEVLRQVEAGARLRVTVDRRPVAELVPLTSRAMWVPRERMPAGLIQADVGLREDLSAAQPDTGDDV